MTKISEYQARDTVAALEQLLEEARAGKITGFAWACKLGPKNHGIGLTGDYRKDPLQVLAISARIEYRLHQIIDKQ